MTRQKIRYFETQSFGKEFKKLQKKFRTLPEDFKVAKVNAIELFHIKNIDNKSVELIPGFKSNKFQIYKLRKFACKSLKGRGVKSGIRIIYALDSVKMNITFLEIYFKGDGRDNEDRNRIKEFIQCQDLALETLIFQISEIRVHSVINYRRNTLCWIYCQLQQGALSKVN